jgi:SAM-dependent methyltransferase
MKEFWNQRYTENDWVYGAEPNQFFKQFIDSHKPGALLLPADGEGRNAVYAASRGWQVDAFDFSEVARNKALAAAQFKNVVINYEIKNIEEYKAVKKYDLVALIYVHIPEKPRKKFHKEIYESIKPGGYLILEAFAKEQLQFDSGGPKEESLLYDAPSICSDFPFLHLINCEQSEVELNEGPYHKGKASLLRLTGQRL